MTNARPEPVDRSTSPDPDDTSFDLAGVELERLGRRVLDLIGAALAAEREAPVLRRVAGAALRERLDERLPRAPSSVDAVLDALRDDILPFARRNGHPRMFGYVVTSADPLGVFADAIASALNQPVTAWRSAPSATEVERLVVRWMHELTGFGGRGGLLVSGGSAANLHGLACAVARAERRAGLPAGSRHRLTICLSTEAHVSMRKAARLLGLPPAHVRVIAVDQRRRMRTDRLRDVLVADRAAGLVPAAVCASAGTANSGAIDPLDEIGDVCAEHRVWYHIDGSYGAPAVLVPAYAWMAAAFARADSVSLDPHKWMFAPADAGCILVRDDADEVRAFAEFSEYTAVQQTDDVERYAAFDHGIEMSRRFRALKVWMILKVRGADAVRDAIARDIALRERLDARIAAEPRLEPLGSELSISCFRYRRQGADDATTDALNRRIVERIIAGGHAYISPTTLDGRFALRVCIVNFRTTERDVDALIDEVLQLGDAMSPGE